VNRRIACLIRPVTKDDFESLAIFFDENNTQETTRHFNPFPLSRESAARIALTSHCDRFYIALVDSNIAGFFMLRGWDEGYQIPSFGVIVHREHRGKGIGRQATEMAITEAKKLGCQSLRLSVYESNANAKHLYISLGFIETSHESTTTNNGKDTKIIMVKRL
jgi:[ribosomal protein S18]-alanine N-acetyltransferase